MTFHELENVLTNFRGCFDFKILGKSVLGKNIYAVNREFNPKFKWALVTAGMHAREHLSCDLVCNFLSQLNGLKQLNFNLSFVPLVNPDGADLCIDGLKGVETQVKQKLLEINGGSEDFSLFKANANGVDLNNNWDAHWENKFGGKICPSRQGFYGFSPMSEPEVISLANWAKSLDLFLCISFHLKGEEIYFDFFQDKKRFKRDKKIAKVFAKSTGYKIKSTQKSSSGGFKDWCVEKLQIPALTIELGEDKFSHPYPKTQLAGIVSKNKNFFSCLEESFKIYEKFEKLLNE